MREIKPETAIKAAQLFDRIKESQAERLQAATVKAYLLKNRSYLMIIKADEDVYFYFFGKDEDGTDQELCMDLNLFKNIQKIDTDAISVLFSKGQNAKNI